MSKVLPDPRFITTYSADHKGPWFYHNVKYPQTLYLPALLFEDNGCGNGTVPGYQRQRPNDGRALKIYDYPFHNVTLIDKEKGFG